MYIMGISCLREPFYSPIRGMFRNIFRICARVSKRNRYRRILHDPERYHEPMTFKPERFLAIDGKEPEDNPSKFAFGYGRRYGKMDCILL